MAKKNKKRLAGRLIYMFLLFVCVTVFVFSSAKVLDWYKESSSTKKEIAAIQTDTQLGQVKDCKATEIVKMQNLSQANPYWSFIKEDMLSVDLGALKTLNPDVKGWIQMAGSNINYPFVQTDNNDFYLKHSFDKKYNAAGWVFMDYRNRSAEDKNTILYAHGRYDRTMFGTLREALQNGWTQNPANFKINISTEEANTMWQVFSLYHLPTTTDYLWTDFGSDQQYAEFLRMIKSRTMHDFKVEVNPTDQILTLSTCFNKREKMVLHAKLIKRSPRGEGGCDKI